jgi:hypothetical protein
MEQVLVTLQRAIDAASSLAAELQSQPSQRDIDDFFSLCQRFIDLRTKCLLAKRIEDDDFPADFSAGSVEASRARYEQLKEEVRAVEQSLQSIEPDRLQSLIGEAKQIFADVTARLDRSHGSDLAELMRLAQEELANLESVTKTHGWYEDAYRRLSEFAGIEIDADGAVRLLGTHRITFAATSVAIDPASVFVGDLDPSASSNAICVSEVIERLAALRDMRAVAEELGWECEVERGAPMVALHAPDSDFPAVFALIGYQDHPLVEWGNVDVETFNATAQPLAEKVRRFGHSARKM